MAATRSRWFSRTLVSFLWDERRVFLRCACFFLGWGGEKDFFGLLARCVELFRRWGFECLPDGFIRECEEEGYFKGLWDCKEGFKGEKRVKGQKKISCF